MSKAAIVFGGSRGIGAAAVERLARDGYAVTFTYRSRDDKAQQLVQSIESDGRLVRAVRADSADVEQIRAAVASAVDSFGELSVVVVNAGLLRSGTIDEVSVDDLDEMLDVNVRGVFLSIQATVAHLVDHARVITIGSNVAVRMSRRGASVYQLTKAAVAAMVKGVALDLAPRGITVNNIQPGPTETDMTVGGLDALAAASPLGRVAGPDEIAGLISYLAGSESRYVTGTSITIDGGFSL